MEIIKILNLGNKLSKKNLTEIKRLNSKKRKVKLDDIKIVDSKLWEHLKFYTHNQEPINLACILLFYLIKKNKYNMILMNEDLPKVLKTMFYIMFGENDMKLNFQIAIVDKEGFDVFNSKNYCGQY